MIDDQVGERHRPAGDTVDQDRNVPRDRNMPAPTAQRLDRGHGRLRGRSFRSKQEHAGERQNAAPIQPAGRRVLGEPYRKADGKDTALTLAASYRERALEFGKYP